ncbi:hypothetical protein MTX78_10385 [Hymenobacter tibetensis]|uniref:Outer membrane protein beta-barrel domain-containing protein n=1 Tax=Hymenobacter tibetensis TaxID=497967 RepID=A0ABY4DA61_9BACT|nr:hypothetical protein [Hymenobacter tibetensis]UOG76988.1 hypothetical protein MTX78_10385 [Hymenobacter tibetensis]
MKLVQKHKVVLLLGVLMLASKSVLAQRVLLRAEVAEDTLYTSFGPNRGFYSHLYIGYLPVVGRAAGSGAELRYGNSAEVMLGVRNKFRLSEPLSVGLDLRFVRLTYALQQTSSKVLPTATVHHKESIAMSELQLEGFVRFNMVARGNVIGRYLDLTGWGGWVMSTANRYEDRPATGPRRVQTTEHGLPYLHRWPVGVGARLGSGRYAAVARYRLSDTFTPAYRVRYPELPRWTVGVELGWL